VKVGRLREILKDFPDTMEVRANDDEIVVGTGIIQAVIALGSVTHHVGDATIGLVGAGVGAEQAKM
jgi:hypothetical protein